MSESSKLKDKNCYNLKNDKLKKLNEEMKKTKQEQNIAPDTINDLQKILNLAKKTKQTQDKLYQTQKEKIEAEYKFDILESKYKSRVEKDTKFLLERKIKIQKLEKQKQDLKQIISVRNKKIENLQSNIQNLDLIESFKFKKRSVAVAVAFQLKEKIIENIKNLFKTDDFNQLDLDLETSLNKLIKTEKGLEDCILKIKSKQQQPMICEKVGQEIEIEILKVVKTRSGSENKNKDEDGQLDEDEDEEKIIKLFKFRIYYNLDLSEQDVITIIDRILPIYQLDEKDFLIIKTSGTSDYFKVIDFNNYRRLKNLADFKQQFINQELES